MKNLSHLIESVPGSPTTLMMQKGRELAAAGHDIVNLAGGEPDFNTPQHVIDAAYKAMMAGDTHYPPSFGTPELLAAIVAKLKRENNVNHITPSQVVVTPGGKWAIYMTLAVTLNPGDEVLVLDPSWVSYAPMVELNLGVAVRVPLPSDDNFAITREVLERYITPRTKLIMLNSPNNPTGRVVSRAEIDALTQVAIEHDLYVMSDEIYEHILFDGAVHYSIAAEPGMAERTIIVNGFSKAYAMTGWRLAWIAGPSNVIKLARTYQTQTVTSAASFSMAAGVAALNGPQDAVKAMTAAYAERRKFVFHAFEEIPGLECAPIEGAFYVFPKFTQTKKNSLEIANILLEKALIASTPGIAFGAAGEGRVRFSIATHQHDLERMVDRLAQIVPTL